jgi:uncharacterized protein DUF5615
VRLLLDVHHSPAVATALTASGHDVIAAATDPVLTKASDEDLLRAAARDERAVVTENARDFDRIVRAWAARGDHHAGVIFTSSRRFRRATRAYPAILISALATVLANPPAARNDWVHWLS